MCGHSCGDLEVAQNNPSTSFTWQRRGLLNSLVQHQFRSHVIQLSQSALRLAVFLKAPSMGTIKHRLVFRDTLFSQAAQDESLRLFLLFRVRADINDCRDQCQNGGTCKVRDARLRHRRRVSECETVAAVVYK